VGLYEVDEYALGKIENQAATVALGYFAYNYFKIHRTLHTSTAMAAGVTDRLWEVSDLVGLGKQKSGGRKEHVGF
jgi:hypothetical protein